MELTRKVAGLLVERWFGLEKQFVHQSSGELEAAIWTIGLDQVTSVL